MEDLHKGYTLKKKPDSSVQEMLDHILGNYAHVNQNHNETTLHTH